MIRLQLRSLVLLLATGISLADADGGQVAGFETTAVGGVYHRLHSDSRTKLLVFRTRSTVLGNPDSPSCAGEVSRRTLLPDVSLIEFADDRSRLDCQKKMLKTGEDLRVEPLVSARPMATLTNRLAVRFRDDEARLRARELLAGFTETRDLPYVDHGYIYRRDLADFSVYDTAHALIVQGYALYAVPVLRLLPRTDVAHRDSIAKDDSTDIDYVEEMNLPSAWATTGTDLGDFVIAVLDDGVQGNTHPAPVCEQLRLESVLDFKNGDSCLTDDPATWCQDCMDVTSVANGWCGTHGNSVALVAGATHDDDDLRGVAPGARFIGSRDKRQFETDEDFADALWWLAGGDPGTGTFNEPLVPGRGASIINLSFGREYLLEKDCPGGPECALVCASDAHCGVIEDCLLRLRNPAAGDGPRELGVIVVNAVGNVANDLATSPNTIAVGSVRFEKDISQWIPFDTSDTSNCFDDDSLGSIHCFGEFVDVVAPLGSEIEGATICTSCMQCQTENGCFSCPSGESLEFGSTSAAAGAVSGLAALILEAGNDKLSADQVHCILEETARPDKWKDPSALSADVDCSFDEESGHSDCLGRGMVDAYAAVIAGKACKSRSRHCPERCVVLPPPAANEQPPRADPQRGRGKGRP